MSVTWGSYTSFGGKTWRVGVEGTINSVNHATGIATVYVTLFGMTNSTSVSYTIPSGVDGTVSLSGDGGGSDTDGDIGKTIYGYASAPTQLHFDIFHVPMSYAGTQSRTASGTTSVVAGASQSVTIPQREYLAPAAPTGATLTRVSDTQHTVSWTNTNPTSSSAPYQNVVVERSVDGGLWAAVATLGVVSSYSATTEANRSYAFRVKATNAGGSSGYATTATGYTTPTAPTGVAAAKAGTDIVVTFDHTARYPTGSKVYASESGGAYSLVGTISTTAESFTHTSPAAGSSWTYKVTATNGSLESALSAASNTVVTLAPPNPPTLLAPTGAVDATEVITLAFAHNPTDTTTQTAYELRYQPTGGTFTTLSGTTAATVDLPAGTLANAGTYEWQARTKGAHADWSDWSTLGSFPTSARPTGTINSPTGTVTGSTITLVWGYYDEEGTAQAQWRATLTDGVTTEVRNGTGTTGTTTFTTPASEGDWDLTIEVMDGSGLWSIPDTQTITVEYAPPPVPALTATFNADTGTAALTVTNPAPVSPEVDTDHNDLYRSLDAGQTWTLIGTDLPTDGSMVDPLPLIGGTTLYKAVAVSAAPSTATSPTVGTDTTLPASHKSWCYANWGTGFTTGIRLRADVTVASDRERAKVLNWFSGREDPIESAGTARTHTLTITGKITDDESTRDELEALADAPAPICWRDPTGRRVFVSSGRVSTSAAHMVQTASVALTRVHHVE